MMYGIDIDQYRLYIVRPALQHIKLWSHPAENLVLGTALVESRLRYVKQLGGGPACGPHQMEPLTHHDMVYRYLLMHPVLRQRVVSLSSSWFLKPNPREMIGNWVYAAALCRIRYRCVPDALPRADDPFGMAKYWKTHYNTHLGKGTVAEATPHFEVACA